jgi:chemotaxis protein MotB
MKNFALLLIAAVFVFSGCVSTKTFDTLSADSEATGAELKKTTDELYATVDELNATRNELEELKAAKEEEIAALNSQISVLTSSGDEKAAEIGSLNEQLAEAAKDKEYLDREVERLRVKAGELSAAKEAEITNLKRTYDDLVKEMQSEIEQGDIKITQAVDRLSVNMVDKILFDSGKAKIKPAGLEVLKRVGEILGKITDKQIRVEGHTDNVKIGPKIRRKFLTNWELSTARATNVVRYFQDSAGLDPELLSATGYSLYRPVAENETTEGRAENRRIEIVLLPLDIDRVLEELKE